jgi:hypothetical protein
METRDEGTIKQELVQNPSPAEVVPSSLCPDGARSLHHVPKFDGHHCYTDYATFS